MSSLRLLSSSPLVQPRCTQRESQFAEQKSLQQLLEEGIQTYLRARLWKSGSIGLALGNPFALIRAPLLRFLFARRLQTHPKRNSDLLGLAVGQGLVGRRSTCADKSGATGPLRLLILPRRPSAVRKEVLPLYPFRLSMRKEGSGHGGEGASRLILLPPLDRKVLSNGQGEVVQACGSSTGRPDSLLAARGALPRARVRLLAKADVSGRANAAVILAAARRSRSRERTSLQRSSFREAALPGGQAGGVVPDDVFHDTSIDNELAEALRDLELRRKRERAVWCASSPLEFAAERAALARQRRPLSTRQCGPRAMGEARAAASAAAAEYLAFIEDLESSLDYCQQERSGAQAAALLRPAAARYAPLAVVRRVSELLRCVEAPIFATVVGHMPTVWALFSAEVVAQLQERHGRAWRAAEAFRLLRLLQREARASIGQLYGARAAARRRPDSGTGIGGPAQGPSRRHNGALDKARGQGQGSPPAPRGKGEGTTALSTSNTISKYPC